jgi:hypothetical protein
MFIIKKVLLNLPVQKIVKGKTEVNLLLTKIGLRLNISTYYIHKKTTEN